MKIGEEMGGDFDIIFRKVDISKLFLSEMVFFDTLCDKLKWKKRYLEKIADKGISAILQGVRFNVVFFLP